MLFLRSGQLALTSSSVLTVLELNEVNVMLKTAKILGRCCLGKGDLLMTGSAVGVLQSPAVALCHSKKNTPLHKLFVDHLSIFSWC